MPNFTTVFLITGFTISFCDACEYLDSLINIFLFKKHLIKFQNAMKNYPNDKVNINKSLSKLLFWLPFYEASNHRKVTFFDENNNCMNYLTSDWLSNIEYFFENDERYPFNVLDKRIKFSLNECDSAFGFSAYALKRATIKLIPIFYANVIIQYIELSFFFPQEQNDFRVSDNRNKSWINFMERIFSFLANVFVVLPVIIKFISSFF